MAFTETTDFAFTEEGILKYAPRSSGVYGIRNSSRWVYVGEAEDMEARLLSHVRRESDQGYCIFNNSATRYTFERVPGEYARKARERALIAELRPVCNRT